MKKIAFLLSMVLLSTTFMAAAGGDFVKTNNGITYFKNVRYGLNSCLIGTTYTGEKMKFKLCDIDSYCKDGETFEKMPVYKNNKATGEIDFMKIVTYRNGLKLYEYEYLSKKAEGLFRRYYVFKGDKFVVELDDINKPSLTAFFQAK